MFLIFLWHEIRLASFEFKRAFPHAPFLQAFIESVAPFPIVRTHLHEQWVIPSHMEDDWVRPSSSSKHPRRAAACVPPTAPSGSASFGCIAHFLGKDHSAMMKAFTF